MSQMRELRRRWQVETTYDLDVALYSESFGLAGKPCRELASELPNASKIKESCKLHQPVLAVARKNANADVKAILRCNATPLSWLTGDLKPHPPLSVSLSADHFIGQSVSGRSLNWHST